MNLTIQNLTIKRGPHTLCRSLSFTVKPGEIWGILGANGSGKTTLLHTLASLHPLSEGEIIIDKKKLNHFSLKEKARLIGILLQDVENTFPQTIWDYCLASRYPHSAYFKGECHLDRHIIKAALTKMNLDALRDKNIFHLSGGEKRRLSIAAMLVQTPQVYLLDEPTNHLDIAQQRNALTHFRELAKVKRSIIMTLHDINIAQHYCDHVLLLLPNAKHLSGLTTDLLTETNLSALYNCPIHLIEQNQRVFWYPAVD